MTISFVLLIAALVCFLLAAFGVAASRVSLTDLGLACLVGAMLAGGVATFG